MAKKNYGKDFEERFAKNWKQCFPKQFFLRLKDDTSGYYGTSKNPCDFITHVDTTLFMIETKCHYKNTFPWSDFPQYETMIEEEYCDLVNVVKGVVVWFIDHDRVIFVDIDTVTKMMQDGLKSININKIDEQGYKYIEIPSVKLRVFMDSDYTVLRSLVK